MNEAHKSDAVPAVQTIGLGKRYGAVSALGAVDLAIEASEYFVLLGPSGGGKTTLLRLIGGFIRASAGRVLLHGQDMTDVPPDRRPTSMVFQSYALFPHMNVARNVGYGLRLRKLDKAEIGRRVGAMLELVGLTGLAERMPHELSGGQQQRVQLARSLVLERDVLLLDEPLAALDAKLRKDMCLELKRIQAEVGITFVHVTHNQEEAMTVADRMAIISGGALVESGTPRQIYERPERCFTAQFIGECNLFEGTIAAVEGECATVDLGFARVRANRRGLELSSGQSASLSLRSELLRVELDSKATQGELQTLPATYGEDFYLGLTSSCIVHLPNGQEVQVRRLSHTGGTVPTAGTTVALTWRTEDARLHVE